MDWSCGDVPTKAAEPRRGKRARSGGKAQSEMKEGNWGSGGSGGWGGWEYRQTVI